jgi:hypothetical protein
MAGIGLSELLIVFINVLIVLVRLAIPVALIYIAWRFSQRIKWLEEQVEELQKRVGP